MDKDGNSKKVDNILSFESHENLANNERPKFISLTNPLFEDDYDFISHTKK